MKKFFRILQEFFLLSTILSFFIACPVIDHEKMEMVSIKYSTAHGTKPVDRIIQKDSVLTVAELPTLTAEGWTFQYWKDSSGTKAEAGKYKATADTTLTAVWEEVIPPTVTIHYSTTHGTSPADKTVEKDTILTAVELPTLTEEGWTFKYWKDSTGTKAEAGKYKATADTTLTAVWEEVIPPTVTIHYSTTHGTAPSDKTVEKDTILTAVELPTLTAEGWTFQYWKDSSGTKAEAGTYKATTDLTLTAVWEEVLPPEPEPQDYTVTITLNITDIAIDKNETADTVTLTATEGYSDYQWMLGDQTVSTTNTVQFDKTQYGTGVYTFILMARKNGLTYLSTAVIVKEPAND